MKKIILVISTALILLVNLSITASEQTTISDNSALNASWQDNEERFHLHSFYNYYSCDGIETKVEKLLSELGARNVKARASGCFEANGRLGNSLTIRVKFQTLSTDAKAGGETTKANFQEVHIKPRHPRSVGKGDCQLIDELQKNILANFEHSVIKENRSCFPGQQSLGDVDWKLKVLKAEN